ncbi:MAG: AsmA family protein [Pseudomonadota bacterium]
MRLRHVAGGIVGLLLALLLGAVLFLQHYDWNRARPWLNARTSEALAHPFEIAGDLAVQWERPAAAIHPQGRSWRDWVPWPHLVAKDGRIGNPAGMPAGPMARVRELSFSLNPLALLSHTIVVPVLRFDAPSLQLQRLADGRHNWTIPPPAAPSRWTLDLERVVFSRASVQLDDALANIAGSAEVDTLDADPNYGVAFRLRGRYHGEAVTGSGKAGAVLSLKQQLAPYPLALDVQAARIHIGLAGTLTRPAEPVALDFRLTVSGPSMARLYPLTGIVLPETPAFSTNGHLRGEVGKLWRYEDFRGKVGASDIAGSLSMTPGKARPLLSGTVVSQLLQFADLAPLIGADSNASKERRGVAPVQPAGKVLPVEPFHTERWTSIDADVRFSAERIVRDKQLPIQRLSTHLQLRDGVLALAPLEFALAGGQLSSTVKLDGSARHPHTALLAEMVVTARHLKLVQLFPAMPAAPATLGEINGNARLSGSGNSIATLLASANGELKALIDRGSVSRLLLEELGLNLGNVVLLRLFGDEQVHINCVAADFDVHQGLMQASSFIADTDTAVVDVTGKVSLASEQLDLTLKPHAKGVRVITLRAPLYVRGSFAQPAVSVDKGVLAMKAGGALALLTVAPLAALLPLVSAEAGQDSPCVALLNAARTPAQAKPR